MSHPEFPNLIVLAHPLIQHKLTILRERSTATRDFKQLVNEIAMLMAYEVTKDLPVEADAMETPLGRHRGPRRRLPLGRGTRPPAERPRLHPSRLGGRGGPVVRDTIGRHTSHVPRRKIAPANLRATGDV